MRVLIGTRRAMAGRRFRELLLAACWLGINAVATAQQPETLFSCVTNPGEPSYVITVPGFPGQRLYLHPKHPDVCSTTHAECAASRYVVAGDELKVTERCGSWAFASFKTRNRVYSGWVATRRLPERYDDPGSFGLDGLFNGLPEVDPQAPTKNPVCAEARDRLNKALLAGSGPERALPSAVTDEHDVSSLPKGVGPPYGYMERIGSTQIQGKRFKAVSYEAGGTCHAGYTQLWNTDFTQRLVVGPDEDSKESGDGNYSSEAIVRLQGQAFFAYFERGARNVRLYGFDAQLAPFAACELSMGTPPRESIRSGTDAELCEAVRDGKVTGAPIDDVEPFPMTPEAFGPANGTRPVRMRSVGTRLVGRGRLDVDNDGTPDEVGIVEYSEDSGAGCGHEYRSWWPVKLNADGMPAAGVFAEESRKIAGSDDESRLFIFRGTTYYERRSRPAVDAVPEHAVWKLTAAGPIQACIFNAVAYGE